MFDTFTTNKHRGGRLNSPWSCFPGCISCRENTHTHHVSLSRLCEAQFYKDCYDFHLVCSFTGPLCCLLPSAGAIGDSIGVGCTVGLSGGALVAVGDGQTLQLPVVLLLQG